VVVSCIHVLDPVVFRGTGSEDVRVALAADCLLAVVLGCKGLERGLDDSTTKAEDEMEGGFLRESDSLSARCLLIEVSCSFVCHFASLQLDFILPPSTTIFPQIQPLHSTDIAYLLDVVVGKSTAVLKLLSSKDQALLVRWDSLLVLDLALDIVDGVG